MNHSTISFYDFRKPETASSRGHRVRLIASKVGKGLSIDAKAQKLAFQHWIEAIDPRHQYGHNLRIYFDEWRKSSAGQPFFLWLDVGEGKYVDLKECPRSKLREQCIEYLGPQERECYEYLVVDGKVIHKLSWEPLDTSYTSSGGKWIYVMSTLHKLYVGEFSEKERSFPPFELSRWRRHISRQEVARNSPVNIDIQRTLQADGGKPEAIMAFLEENGVNLNEVEINKLSDDSETHERKSNSVFQSPFLAMHRLIHLRVRAPKPELEPEPAAEDPEVEENDRPDLLSGGLQSPRRLAQVPRRVVLERISSKKATVSYQLGHQLSRTWSTGAGPRIGCVADYPPEIRHEALEFVNLSHGPIPRTGGRRSAGRDWVRSPLLLKSPEVRGTGKSLVNEEAGFDVG